MQQVQSQQCEGSRESAPRPPEPLVSSFAFTVTPLPALVLYIPLQLAASVPPETKQPQTSPEGVNFLPLPFCIYSLPIQDFFSDTLQLNLFVSADVNVHIVKTYVCEIENCSKFSSKDSAGITTKQVNSYVCVFIRFYTYVFVWLWLSNQSCFHLLPWSCMHPLHPSPYVYQHPWSQSLNNLLTGLIIHPPGCSMSTFGMLVL